MLGQYIEETLDLTLLALATLHDHSMWDVHQLLHLDILMR